MSNDPTNPIPTILGPTPNLLAGIEGRDGLCGVVGFTYTQKHLQDLRLWLNANGGIFSKALPGFLESIGSNDWIQYLEFCECIANDRDFPEKHFTATECSS